jgi:hypothetical protein
MMLVFFQWLQRLANASAMMQHLAGLAYAWIEIRRAWTLRRSNGSAGASHYHNSQLTTTN